MQANAPIKNISLADSRLRTLYSRLGPTVRSACPKDCTDRTGIFNPGQSNEACQFKQSI